MWRNNLTGGIPVELSVLVHLEYMAINSNPLGGSIPPGLGNLTLLSELKLFDSFLNGTIPLSLGNLPNLQYLCLAGNSLTGPIPDALGNLGNLTSLKLFVNSLTDSIPKALSGLQNLQYLAISHNNLSGHIPVALTHLKNLTSLKLFSNQLSGSIPSELGSLLSLQYMAISNNYLSGSLPRELGQLKNLTELKAFSNSLSGTIPEDIGSLPNLQYLGLGYNAIFGSIPQSLLNMPNLTELDLFGNWLSGDIPGATQSVPRLKYLDISSNQLTGSIPDSLSTISTLRWLDLSHNQLSGTIPSSLPAIRYLNLGWNMLYGKVPVEVSASPYLFVLFVEGNQLSGDIPFFWSTYNNSMNFFSNYFTGCSEEYDPQSPSYNSLGSLSESPGSFDLNCLRNNSPCATPKQRPAQACAQFCGITAEADACSGRGNCSFDQVNNLFFCSCDPGYTTNYTNPQVCLLQSQLRSSTLAAASASSDAAVTRALGIQLPLNLWAVHDHMNKWSRYLSVGYVSGGNGNGSSNDWEVQNATMWMGWSWYRNLFVNEPKKLRPGSLVWTTTRQQGKSCESCWAHSAVDAVASAMRIASSPRGGAAPVLAAGQLQSCANASADPCAGSYPIAAFEYSTGAPVLARKSWVNNPVCPSNRSSSILMYEAVQFRDWFGLLLTLQVQPAIVILDGTSPTFQDPSRNCSLKNFVMSSTECFNGNLSHSVLVVGYDLRKAKADPWGNYQAYWLIRNSWGGKWCMRGFMRIAIQGGDGVCGMNKLPAYYPIAAPKPNDPCYKRSKGGLMNPCGGGTCLPRTELGPYAYACDCSRTPSGAPLTNFVAKNNTVPSLPNTQSCVPANPCTMSGDNPCRQGTCVTDYQGSYSCICPLGFRNTSSTDFPSCELGVSSGVQSFVVQGNVTCAQLSLTFNLSAPQLERNNKGVLNCSTPFVKENVTLNVTNEHYRCSIAYFTTRADRTCQDVVDRLTPSSTCKGNKNTNSPQSSQTITPTTTEATAGDPGAQQHLISLPSLKALNPYANCDNLTRGTMLCLREGVWPSPFVCNSYYILKPGETCKDAIDKVFCGDPAMFYVYNPGINCDALAAPAGARGEATTSIVGGSGNMICAGVIGVGSPSPAKCGVAYCPYILKNKEPGCATLVKGTDKGDKINGQFKTWQEVQKLNSLPGLQDRGWSCTKPQKVLCYNKLPCPKGATRCNPCPIN